MLFNIASLLTLGALASALPAEEVSCPRTRCFDAVNKCGIKYGRCYDMCTQEMPPPPPCPGDSSSTTATLTTITLPTTTIVPTTTITSIPSITPVPTITSSASACPKTGTSCVDYLRSCGSPPTAILTYGGCFPACGPTPTFSPPPCPEPTTA